MARQTTLLATLSLFISLLLLHKQVARLSLLSVTPYNAWLQELYSSNDDYWSAHALMQRNVSTVFAVPEEHWTLSSSAAAGAATSDNNNACPVNFSIFVYDDLPHNLTVALEATVRTMIPSPSFNNNNSTNSSTDVFLQENVATEWALVQLFRTSPCQTLNPHDETKPVVYVVPYMHFTHCFLAPGYAHGCGQVQDAEMDELFASLSHYNQSTWYRHVFINIYDTAMSKKHIGHTLLKLSSGPVAKHYGDRPRSIVVPIFNDDPRFQPSVLMQHGTSWWTTRPRRYSFVSAVGGRNPRMRRRQPRRFREYFTATLNASPYATNQTLGGLPYRAISFALGETYAFLDFPALYRNSIFCPILAGDTSWQRRFFDVIRCGCLPVLLEWPAGGDERGRSWHAPNSFAVQDSYPFAVGRNTSYNLAAVAAGLSKKTIAIDYDSFVVRVPGNMANESDLSAMFDTMHHMLLHQPEEIAKRQRNMMAVAPHLTFGLGRDAHKYDDAFRRILYTLEILAVGSLAN